jgi:LysR family transcriptional regulator, hydrogen peroxide-inducible genes activator
VLQENFTVKLLDMLRNGEIDCAVMAEPFPDHGLAIAPLYDEPFLAAMPAEHPLAARQEISAQALKNETLLLLGTGHCFRDHVLEVCPEFARFASGAEGIQKSFEGSSLETIKHMVAAGMGVTLVPRLSVPEAALAASAPVVKKSTKAKKPVTPEMPTAAPSGELRYIPVVDEQTCQAPTRRVVLAWRRSFTRYAAIAELRNAIYACKLPGVTRLS